MDFSLTEEQQMMRDAARRFAEERVRPTMEEDEKNHYFRKELVYEMAELGFFGCLAPEELGGTGVGHLAASIMAMELARVSPSWGLPFNMQMNGLQTVLLNRGTEEQKAAYIPKLISAELFGCFAITEPNTGSDVASMRTWAADKGDHFVLNGNKMWISNVPYADLGVVYAVTDPEAKPRHRGISAFIVDMKSEGVIQKAILTKLGLHCAPTGEIYFEDVKVPKENLVGKPGDGFKICMEMLDVTRLSCAARAVGVAQGCIDACTKYVKERYQFGKPIGEFQMIQAQLAEMVAEHEAAELLVYRAATLKDSGSSRSTYETSVAKYLAAEGAVHAANEACKIFGSYGFSSEYPVERFLRDSKSFQVVEGTSNVQKMIIARHTLAD